LLHIFPDPACARVNRRRARRLRGYARSAPDFVVVVGEIRNGLALVSLQLAA
jgi:hypothetical protein